MPDKLVIVESPAKAKTIGKILGKDYIIKASFGHIRDLPERSFGVDIEHDFKPQYEESKARGKNLSELKQNAKAVKEIYLAPDPDREGEAIAWHLHEVLKNANKKAEFKRVAFHEITKSAISKAFQTPGEVNMSLVDAQQARRVLDRIVGYMISPLLWSKIERGISAGRVQSVALRLVCEREREIQAFLPKEYWNFQALFHAPDSSPFTAKLFKLNNDKFEINNKTDADAVVKDVSSALSWKVSSIETQPRKRYAPPPFITSTLQQAASSSLGFSANSTMRVAQQLYEGVDTGHGQVGLITYMRTDAVNVAVEAQNACRAFIGEAFGKEYVPAKPNFFRTKATAQAAHEAIRPTDVTLTPEDLKSSLEPNQYKLYRLIWRRFVACQMAPAEQLRTTVDVSGKGAKNLYTFRSVATVTTFPGFLKAYDIEEEGAHSDDDEYKDADTLAKLKENMACALRKMLSEQKFTEPPPRFSEATLIKELESNGIGRPSTYASIVNTIQERKYVWKEKGKLSPTDLGFRVNDYLVESLPELMKVGFTADMENKLDRIEEGGIEWTRMLREFYDKFEVWLKAAKTAGAPEAGKARTVLDILSKIKKWADPEQGAKKVYDDKKFFTSVQTKAEKGAGISARQWEALLSLLAKYADQLPNARQLADDNGFGEEYSEAVAKFSEKETKRRERAERMESAGTSPSDLSKLLDAMKNISWNPPEKRGARVYDDKKFFDSLKQQEENGRELSEKQVAALVKLAGRYSEGITGYADLIKNLTGSDAVPVENPETAHETDALLDALSKITKWNEPEKKGRRVYDDKEFYESLFKQKKSGKVLSFKQVAALKKLAAKYQIQG